MKKFIIAAAVMGLMCGVSEAKNLFEVPAANTSQPAPIGYGGVLIATSTFNGNFSTVTTGECLMYGVTFSSGSSTDFVQLFSTGTLGAGVETIRLYNIASSTQGAGAPGISAGYVRVGDNPIRARFGCGFRVSTSFYNSVILHYMKDE